MVEFAAWLAVVGMPFAGPPPRTATSRPEQASTPVEPATAVDELIVIAPKREDASEPPPKINFDVKGRFEREKTPYWQRPLENGCRVTAAGLACVRRF